MRISENGMPAGKKKNGSCTDILGFSDFSSEKSPGCSDFALEKHDISISEVRNTRFSGSEQTRYF